MHTNVSAANLSYSIDRQAGLLRQVWRGTVTTADVGAFWMTLFNDVETLALGRHLDDLRDCRFAFSGNEWLDLIKSFLLNAPPHAKWKAAFVVNSSEMYGVLRQFMAYGDGLVEGEIFSDMESAQRWLEAGK